MSVVLPEEKLRGGGAQGAGTIYRFRGDPGRSSRSRLLTQGPQSNGDDLCVSPLVRNSLQTVSTVGQ